MKKPRPKPQSKTSATSQQNAEKSESRAPNQYGLIFFGAVVTAVVAGIIGLFFSNISNIVPESADDPHTYSFVMQGRTISGESTNRFEEARGYQARVEACEKYGIEDILITVSCYLTVRPVENLTISNSENPTTAIYEDGSVATICCMHFEDNLVAPLYRIRLPRGSVTRRTYRRGDEIHIILNIPNADPSRNLDAISFSPGEGAPAVLFPLRGNLNDRVFSTEFINSRRDDPRIQQIVRESLQLRDQSRARERQNEGLTYPQETNGIR